MRRRLNARKSPRFVEAATPAERIRHIRDAALAHPSGAVAVFVERVADARRIARGLVAALGPESGERVAVLTGTLRGHERAMLTDGVVWRRFTHRERHPPDAPSVYLVATAAGEVGVDLDADHAVMDLATLDSMIQRLGRVNRAGEGDAKVSVVFTTREARGLRTVPTSYRERREAARAATLDALRRAPSLSPKTLRGLDPDTVAACSVPSARPAPLDAVVLEAFAATSAALPRPPVAVYLRGVSDEPHIAQCFLAWRRDVAELVGLGALALSEVLAFFAPRPEELARVPASFARSLVQCAIERLGGAALPLVVAGRDGEVFAGAVRDAAALPSFEFATVVLPSTAGGLSADGLPDADAQGPVEDVADTEERIRYIAPCPPGALPAWAEGAVELRVPLGGEGDEDEDEEEERFLVFAQRRPDPGLASGERDLGRLPASAQTIDGHCAAVAAAARRIGSALGLPEDLVDALERAGRWHDRGKSRAVWQRAAGVIARGAGACEVAPRTIASAVARRVPPRVRLKRRRRARTQRRRPPPRPRPASGRRPPRLGAAGVPRPRAVRPRDPFARERALRAARGPPLRPSSGAARAVAPCVARGAGEGGRRNRLERGAGCTAMRVWPVDPGNPGEVLACAGLAHLAWRADAQIPSGFVRGRGGGLRFVVPDAMPLPEDAGAWPLAPDRGPAARAPPVRGRRPRLVVPLGAQPWDEELGRGAVGVDRAPEPSPRTRAFEPVGVARAQRTRRGRAALPRPPLELGHAGARLEPERAPGVSHARPALGRAARIARPPGVSGPRPPRPRWVPLPAVAHRAAHRRARRVLKPRTHRRDAGRLARPHREVGGQHRPSPGTTRTRRCNVMTPSLHALIADTALVALTLRQPLASVEASDVPIAPPTYPPSRESGAHRFATPYTVNETRAGVRLCDLDSVQSQANRMEGAFTEALADVVPHHVVRAGGFERDLTALPHRIADAAIRATALSPSIHAAFEAFEAGDAVPLARIAPTSLVYGAWDSRATRVRIPRAIASTIRAVDVSVLTGSAQYSGAFPQGQRSGSTTPQWKKAAASGLAPAPCVDRPGGVLVHGAIVQSASVVLDGLRGYRTADASDSAARLPARPRARRARDHRAALSAALRVHARPRWTRRVARGHRLGRAPRRRHRRRHGRG